MAGNMWLALLAPIIGRWNPERICCKFNRLIWVQSQPIEFWLICNWIKKWGYPAFSSSMYGPIFSHYQLLVTHVQYIQTHIFTLLINQYKDYQLLVTASSTDFIGHCEKKARVACGGLNHIFCQITQHDILRAELHWKCFVIECLRRNKNQRNNLH